MPDLDVPVLVELIDSFIKESNGVFGYLRELAAMVG